MHKEQFWPTIASLIIPLVQLFAVLVVDINDTLKLDVLFNNPDILPVANLLSLMLICAGIGVYWYWKENYFWLNTPHNQNLSNSHQKSVNTFLFAMIIVALVSCIVIVGSLIGGKSPLVPAGWHDLLAVVQIVSYITFVTSVGVVAYVGLSEYSKKQKDFKPDQYLSNLLSSMQLHGIVTSPVIHIKERKPMSNNGFQTLVKLEINGQEKYLITTYDGKEITKEFNTVEEYNGVEG